MGEQKHCMLHARTILCSDVVRCDFEEDWCESEQKRSPWQEVVKMIEWHFPLC